MSMTTLVAVSELAKMSDIQEGDIETLLAAAGVGVDGGEFDAGKAIIALNRLIVSLQFLECGTPT